MTKVLLVEDDNNLREIYEARLVAEGYDIVTAKDGEDALAVAKQHQPELIISDVMMPRISGFEMLDILRNTDGLKHTKIIMLTALGQSEDKTRADSLGADRYLVKSQVTLEDIVKAADELLNPDSSEEENTEIAAQTPAVADIEVPTPDVSAPVVSEPSIAAPTAPGSVAVNEPVVPSSPPEMPVISSAPQSDAAVPAPTVADQEPQPAPVTAPVAPDTAPTASEQTAPVSAPEVAAIETTQPVSSTPESTAPTVATPETPQEPTQQDIPADTTEADSTPVDQGIPVLESATLGVQMPAPGADEEAEPRIQMPPTEANDGLSEAQPAAEEAATVEKQIDEFVQTHQDTTPEADNNEEQKPAVLADTPATSSPTDEAGTNPEDDANNAALIEAAVNELASTATQAEAAPVVEQQPAPAPQAEAATEQPTAPAPAPQAAQAPEQAPEPQSQQVSGKKVIQPISNPTDGVDIHTLVAQEEARANMETAAASVAQTPAPQPSEPAAPVIQPGQPTPEATPGVTPLPQNQQPTTQQPGGVFTPNNNGDADMKAL